ncbi:hypothetical protein [Nocardioides limicola]|uniref:hypothetical protein n=1 Tax=Nocardioides limicola TaxID=2803368 RepID=UPI00193BBBCC|nr:hypothetical protein [Nocardioides sp. DJM-14]
MGMRRKATRVAVTAALLIAATGCGESLSERGAERLLEQFTDAENVDVDFETGDFSVTTEDGSVQMGARLPQGFPDDVPLVSGEVLHGAEVLGADGEAHWTVSLQVTGAPTDAYRAAVEQLEAVGFTSQGSMDLSSPEETVLGATFERPPYTVVVSVISDEPTMLNYVVGRTG